ncbi:MAG: formylglycine-generating enzyme family protein, partial [Methylovulum sp.]|nr:formylglycine-generating enzyme family protein [Methylovulum sp.]
MKPCPANGLIGRADLLRLLATAPRPYLVLDDDGEHQFGYRQKDIPIEQNQPRGTIIDPPPPDPLAQTGNFKLPLQMPFVHVIAERQARQLQDQRQNTGQTVAIYDPISEDDAKPPSAVRLVNYQVLVPKARLMPALKRYLSTNRTAGLDVPLLVKQIAGQQLPRHLPRRQVKSWHPQWVVVLDFTNRLWPYRQDMHQLAEHLLRACGRSGVSIRIINHGPLLHWTDWVEEQQGCGALPTKNAWRMPPADTPVLLVSDLGLLEGPDSTTHHAWQVFVRQLTKAQTQPLALLPLASEQLDAGLPNSLTLLRWSPDARIHPERALGNGQATPVGLDDLLAMAAVTRRVDPPLLRALRRLNPKAPLNAGLEGAFWCHADVQSGSAANIRHDAQADHLVHFSQRLHAYHKQLELLRHRHHAHLRAVLNHEETLLWASHVKLEGADMATEIAGRLKKAETFMRQLAATLTQPDGLQKAGIWWNVAQDIVQRADNQMGERYMALLAPLVQAIAEVRGAWQHPPDWVDPAYLSGDGHKFQSCWLVNDPATCSIVLQSTPPARNQSALTAFLSVDQGGLRIESAGSRVLLSIRHLPYRLCGLQEETQIKLTTSQESLKLASVKRPRGSAAWGYDTSRSGLWVKSASLCGQLFEWNTWLIPIEPSLQLVLAENGQYQLVEHQLSKQIDLRDVAPTYITCDYNGKTASSVKFILDQFGIRADLNLITPLDDLIQGLRWIEPGTFWMGSPDDESQRSDNEGPRHEVTLSQGFWLADTACTQALWQAVMGNNPSCFKDNPQQPVEQVSWHDVQKFLQGLQALLPGCQVDLPSEAEWEYACRAGTTTPFSFGANINTQQVNYHGDYPYVGSEKGVYLAQTVLVKSLPANPWGLYEMHGNVLEYCKDGQRDYDGQAQIDPLGPLIGVDRPRTVRGGSWGDDAGWVCSASRAAIHPSKAYINLGFRFCLRPIQPGQEQVSPDAEQEAGKSSDSRIKSKL